MFERLVLEVEFNVGAAIGGFHNSKEDLDCPLRNGLLVLGLAELHFIAPNIAHLINEENLVDIDSAPLIDDVLDNLLALDFAHCYYFAFHIIISLAYL